MEDQEESVAIVTVVITQRTEGATTGTQGRINLFVGPRLDKIVGLTFYTTYGGPYKHNTFRCLHKYSTFGHP